MEVAIDRKSLRVQADTEYRQLTKLRPVTMRLDADLIRALKRIASSQGVSYQTLARMWLRERAIEELRHKASHAEEVGKERWPLRVGERVRIERLFSAMREELSEVRNILGHARSGQTTVEYPGDGKLRTILHRLREATVPINELDPPETRGVYALFLVDGHALPGLQVQEADPIYIGISSNLARRQIRNHFDSTKTGFSTVRRTLGALLKNELRLTARPRGQGTGQRDFTNYRFDLQGELRLTEWMHRYVHVAVLSGEEFVAVEKELISFARPPLNLTEGPDSARIKELRQLCAREARGRMGV